jgi:hypothetical protein
MAFLERRQVLCSRKVICKERYNCVRLYWLSSLKFIVLQFVEKHNCVKIIPIHLISLKDVFKPLLWKVIHVIIEILNICARLLTMIVKSSW